MRAKLIALASGPSGSKRFATGAAATAGDGGTYGDGAGAPPQAASTTKSAARFMPPSRTEKEAVRQATRATSSVARPCP
jgi:hypothetical protein